MKKKRKLSKAKAARKPRPKNFEDVENIPFRKALRLARSRERLGLALGVSRQMVNRWDFIPERFAVRVEELYGIPRAQIAPNLYKGMVPAK